MSVQCRIFHAVTESVPEASSVPSVAGFPIHHNPFRILDHEIQLTGGMASVESDSEDEEVVPLLNPRRNRSDHNVSPVVQKQEISAGSLPAESEIKVYNQPMGTEIKYVQAPSVNSD